MKEKVNFKELEKAAGQIRRNILQMLEKAGTGHPGGSLSCVELMVGLYLAKMRHDPKNPCWENRDRFILSKGHGCPTLYAALSYCGYFPHEELLTLRSFGSRLQGHPARCVAMGIEVSSGSLGQGLSIANGLCLAAKMDKKQTRVYCLMGDGETNEGQVWEAAMTAAHYKLDNLCAIIDFNNQQIDGWLKDVKDMEPYAEKWKAFAWHVLEINGHDFNEILTAFDTAEQVKDKPTLILAHTIKGKGVSFMENNPHWHGVAPNKDELNQALAELKI
ncbi:MAG: transketolase [Candidatus Omnitrophota bacterium]